MISDDDTGVDPTRGPAASDTTGGVADGGTGAPRSTVAEMEGRMLRSEPARLLDLALPSTAAEADGPVLHSTISYEPQTRERYSLTRLHATGGVGQVWLARDADLGRQVALKELRPERAANQAMWGRFLEEAKITGQLEHPGIVPVYELARRSEDQTPFYTMRFVRGRTLTRR